MLILVRHGQTAANADGLLLGRADPPLTELGRRQARALAASLGDPVRIVSSSLTRARDTAAAFGGPVEVDDRWIELDYGGLDGKPYDEVLPAVWRRWRADPSYAPGGAESRLTLGRRVRSACEALAEEARAADATVVSHVSPIKASVAWALAVGDEMPSRTVLSAAAVTRIAVDDHGPVLRSFNDCSHLEGVGSKS